MRGPDDNQARACLGYLLFALDSDALRPQVDASRQNHAVRIRQCENVEQPHEGR
ncbi:hypothetical protein [Streptomyces sp. NBRC 110611]|uniref:hypothetical protein n=1 Tax=Streptomyces sp. NBRC 110611 TaxID=1621259 RepID=UPI0015EEB7E4|nr:hypothetical protein [Streptomyces sp. NBRC 110611]